ncbi:PKD domain-containing protein [Parasediminibacterium sp. JCM 36343]|uniref:PKD domain-containing protein n=1 Tax=Parasediminibacterium sp. JCM 36343 TaxID=3374279 RepID=UPI0039792072
MNITRQFAGLLLAFLAMFSANAQADTTFWFAAPAVTPGHENKPIVVRMATYNQPADISISEPANPSFVPYSFHLSANSATTVDLTTQIDLIENKPGNTVLNYGIKIAATATISAYYEVGKVHNPEIFPLKGKIATGYSFLIPAQTLFNDKDKLNPPAKNGFVIVATEDNTTVTVTLTKPDSIGHLAGVPFSITLNKGQSYAVIAASIAAGGHLGGSAVKSDKPICVTIFDDSVQLGTHYDLIGDQIVPEAIAGNQFILVRGDLNNPPNNNGDYFFVWAISDNTTVSVNGTAMAKINRGQSYQGAFTDANAYIATDNPVYVLQLTGVQQEVAATSLPGIECTGSQNVSFVRSTTEYFQLNVLCKQTEVNNFLVNGAAGIITASMFQDVSGTNGIWKVARITTANLPNINNVVFAGAVTSVSNTSGLFHIGFLNGAVGTGTRLGYFSNYGLGSLAPIPVSNVCDNKNIQLQANQYPNTQYNWRGPLGFSSTIYNPSITNAQPANSGTYIVTANVQGCGNFTDSVHITIYPLATAAFSKNDIVCLGNTATLTVSLTGKAPWKMIYTDGSKNDTITNIPSSTYSFSVAPSQTTTYSIINLTDATPCNTGAVTNKPGTSATVFVNQLPTAVFSGGDSLCIGKQKAVSISLTGKAPWQLAYSDGVQTTTVSNITVSPFMFFVSPTATTTYTITNLVDSNGCQAVLPIAYTLHIFQRPATAFSLPAEACMLDTVRPIDQSINNGLHITKWFWTFGDGTTDTLQNPAKAYSAANQFPIALYSINNAGCYSDTVTKPIVINPLPQAAFTIAAAPYCETKPIAFTDDNSLPNVGNITRWQWDMGNSRQIDTTNGNTFTNAYTTTGSYTVQLMVENSKGCKSTKMQKTITINPLPNVGFTVPEICLNDAFANFKDTSSIADPSEQLAYSWNFGSASALPTSSHQSIQQVKYSQVGNYFVSDTVTSSKGCVAVKTQLFVVNGTNPSASFVLKQSPSQSNILCSKDSVTIINNSTNPDFGTITKLEVYWDNANKPTVKDVYENPITGQQFSHLYPALPPTSPSAKQYTIRVAVYSGGVCSNDATQDITLNPSPEVAFSPVKRICTGSDPISLLPLVLEQSGGDGTPLFSGTGVNGNGIFNPQPLAPGSYYTVYKYTTKVGCADTAGQAIKVLPSPSITLADQVYVLDGSPVVLKPLAVTDTPLVYRWLPIDYLSNPDTSATIAVLPFLPHVDSLGYTLTVTDTIGCPASGHTTLIILHPPAVPNVFSPNGDTRNDTWKLKNLDAYPDAVVQVFDRSGQLVYKSEGYYTPWDGTYHGNPLPVGTYYYIISPKNGRQTMSGSVTIIR